MPEFTQKRFDCWSRLSDFAWMAAEEQAEVPEGLAQGHHSQREGEGPVLSRRQEPGQHHHRDHLDRHPGELTEHHDLGAARSVAPGRPDGLLRCSSASCADDTQTALSSAEVARCTSSRARSLTCATPVSRSWVSITSSTARGHLRLHQVDGVWPAHGVEQRAELPRVGERDRGVPTEIALRQACIRDPITRSADRRRIERRPGPSGTTASSPSSADSSLHDRYVVVLAPASPARAPAATPAGPAGPARCTRSAHGVAVAE